MKLTALSMWLWLDHQIDARLSSPETVEGRLVRYGTSWGVWVAEKLPFGSETVIKVIDDIVRIHMPVL